VSSPDTTIEQVEIHNGRVVLKWCDGHESLFHPLWLRDNCMCSQCGNRAVGQKLAYLMDLPEKPTPNAVTLTSNGALHIRWVQDDHETTFAASWLREHCYSEAERLRRRHQPILWNHSLQDRLPQTTYGATFHDDRGHHELLSFIRDYGFALVHDVPTSQEGFARMAGRIGYIRETNYGKFSDLKVSPGPARTLSDTNHRIPLHTDECYRHANPGMLAFQCVSASEDGAGATQLADGFSVAEHVRNSDPEAFELLCRVSVASRRFEHDNMDLRSQSPVISVDNEGRVQGVRYNERSAAPLDIDEALVEPTYAALRCWLKACSDPGFRIGVVLQPGDFVVFDNQRVLHGRDTFGGGRHLYYCQLDLDEPHSRVRVLDRRLGLPADNVTIHRGT